MTMHEKHSEPGLPVPTAEDNPSVSENPSVATSLKLAPEELEKEHDTNEVELRDESSPTGADGDKDVYFHGMQLMPVFVAIMLAVFLIAIDQVRSIYIAEVDLLTHHRQLSVLPFRRSRMIFGLWRVYRGTAQPTS
jgi:hypothetical protein